MVQAPVGIRCRECGRAVRMPTYDVQPTYYAKAIGIGVAVAIGGGLLWSLLIYIVPFFSSFGAMAVGYGAGELVSRSVNRKQGIGLAWVAGMLPDLDSESGRPVREIFGLIAAIVPFEMMDQDSGEMIPVIRRGHKAHVVKNREGVWEPES